MNNGVDASWMVTDSYLTNSVQSASQQQQQQQQQSMNKSTTTSGYHNSYNNNNTATTTTSRPDSISTSVDEDPEIPIDPLDPFNKDRLAWESREIRRIKLRKDVYALKMFYDRKMVWAFTSLSPFEVQQQQQVQQQQLQSLQAVMGMGGMQQGMGGVQVGGY
ncbi:hypothetical protein HDU76_011278 [Blyttiomyces sp. JEL0837]|nr:hypothetical protein HDU76_011278 [Blyttiomyces sp. JEL0837]